MERPDQYLEQCGGLHEAHIPRFLLDVVRATILIDVCDIDANFEDQPGYAGARPARLVFSGVSSFHTDVRDIAGNLIIHELTAAFAGDRHRATLVLHHGDRMAWDFTGFEVVDIPPADAAIP